MGDDRGSQIRAVTYVMLILATVAVALRLWARHITRQARFWWDDWLCLAALPFVWTSCALSIYWVHIGLGRHINEVPGPHSQLALVLFIENFIYNTGLSLVKMSVLLFYSRFFGNVPVYRYFLWIAGFLVVGWLIAINFLALFMCVPVRKQWQPKVPGHCLNSHTCFLGATITNVIIDIILLVLPVPMLWRIQVKVSRKVGLVGVFAVGYCVVILSVLRLISITDMKDELQHDMSWSLTTPQILVTCEVPVALTSSCLPLIFALLKQGAQKLPFNPRWTALKLTRSLSTPNIDPIGLPLDDHNNKKGFLQLQSDTLDSQERLFQNNDMTRAEMEYPVSSAPGIRQIRGNLRQDSEMGIPLHQIRGTKGGGGVN